MELYFIIFDRNFKFGMKYGFKSMKHAQRLIISKVIWNKINKNKRNICK